MKGTFTQSSATNVLPGRPVSPRHVCRARAKRSRSSTRKYNASRRLSGRVETEPQRMRFELGNTDQSMMDFRAKEGYVPGDAYVSLNGGGPSVELPLCASASGAPRSRWYP
jgi:hypothetical protein